MTYQIYSIGPSIPGRLPLYFHIRDSSRPHDTPYFAYFSSILRPPPFSRNGNGIPRGGPSSSLEIINHYFTFEDRMLRYKYTIFIRFNFI